MSDEKKEVPKWFLDLRAERQKVGEKKYGNAHMERSVCRDILEELADADNILVLLMKKVMATAKTDSGATRLLDDLSFKLECIDLHELIIDCVNQLIVIKKILDESRIEDVDKKNINRPYFDYKLEE